MPEYQDEVVHVYGEVTGTVIATYTIDNVLYLDVRSDDRIYYKTPAENWQTTIPVDE